MFIMKAPMGIFIMQREPVQLVLPKLKLDLGHWDLSPGVGVSGGSGYIYWKGFGNNNLYEADANAGWGCVQQTAITNVASAPTVGFCGNVICVEYMGIMGNVRERR